MQIDRLFKIINILMTEKSITAQKLAETLGVSVRTIYRDIDVLSVAGVPVCSAAGKGGGYSLMEGYVLDSAAVTKEEQQQILGALGGLSAAGNVGVEDTLTKLRALFRADGEDWLEVDHGRWGPSGQEDNDKFQMLRDAILTHKVIAFEYINTYGQCGRRRAESYKLAYKSKAWYLQAYCIDKNGYRLFKLNRLSGLAVEDQQFERRTELPSIEERSPDGREYPEIVLRFRPGAAYRVYDEFPLERVQREDDGTLTVRERMPEDEWLYGLLLSFGTNVEVVSPTRIRERLKEEIKKLAQFYDIR